MNMDKYYAFQSFLTKMNILEKLVVFIHHGVKVTLVERGEMDHIWSERERELKKNRGWGLGERGSVLLEQLSCSWNLLFNGNLQSLPNYTPASWYEPWCRHTRFLAFGFWLDTPLRCLLCKKWPLVSKMPQRGNAIKIPRTHYLFLYLFSSICGLALTLTQTAGAYWAGKIGCGHYNWGFFALCLWLVSHGRLAMLRLRFWIIILDDHFSNLFIGIVEFWVCNIEYCAAGVSGICYEQWHIPLEDWVGTAGAPLNRQAIVYQWGTTAIEKPLKWSKTWRWNRPHITFLNGLWEVCSHSSVKIIQGLWFLWCGKCGFEESSSHQNGIRCKMRNAAVFGTF